VPFPVSTLYSGGFIIVVFVTYVKTHTHKCLAHSRFRAKYMYVCMYIATMVFMIIVIYDNDDDDDDDDMTSSSTVVSPTTMPPISPRRYKKAHPCLVSTYRSYANMHAFVCVPI